MRFVLIVADRELKHSIEWIAGVSKISSKIDQFIEKQTENPWYQSQRSFCACSIIQSSVQSQFIIDLFFLVAYYQAERRRYISQISKSFFMSNSTSELENILQPNALNL